MGAEWAESGNRVVPRARGQAREFDLQQGMESINVELSGKREIIRWIGWH